MKGIILIGCPGAGKGTIGEYLQSKYEITHLSSGDILRDEVKNGSKIGKEIENTIKLGNRVEDVLITRLVLNKLEQFIQQNQSFVLDGFPQTSQQIQDLNVFTHKHSGLNLRYIYVVVDKNTALERMSNRLSCATCHAIYNKTFFSNSENLLCTKCDVPLVFRESDQSELAKKRIETFFKTSEVLVKNELKQSLQIDGNQPLLEIRKAVDNILQEIN